MNMYTYECNTNTLRVASLVNNRGVINDKR